MKLSLKQRACSATFLTFEASIYVLLPEQVALLAVLPDCLALVVELRGGDPMIGPIEPHLLLQSASQGDGLYASHAS